MKRTSKLTRSPLKRTALRRGASKLKRSTRMRPIGKRGREDRAAIDAVRGVVLKRARGRCERCGASCSKPDLHHLLARSQGGKHEALNLVALCSGPNGCHAKVHAHLVSDWRRWIVTRRGVA